MLRFGRKKSARRAGVRIALLTGAAIAALGVGGLSAGSASAALSCTGSNIIGQGSSLQKIAQQNVWTPKFSTEICNKGQHPTVTYNSTGSGAGLNEWNATGGRGSLNLERQYIGTDDAPSVEQMTNIDSVAGGAHVLVIPVAQTTISIVANPPSGCTVEEITNANLQAVFRGVDLKWSNLATAEGSCNSPITRVVRLDGSGTTFQFKNYLSLLSKTGLPCTTGGTEGKANWTELEPVVNGETGAPNTTWPESCEAAKLSKLVRPAGSGGGEVVKKVNATAGSIGYAALPDAKSNNAVDILTLQNNGLKPLAEATFANPALGAVANCAEASYLVPEEAQRGLGTGLDANWSRVFGAMPTAGGTRYPLCTLTYDLAFHGYLAAGFTARNESTIHDYLKEYVVHGGQAALETSGTYYSALPTSSIKKRNVLAAAQYTAEQISQ